MVVCLRSYFLSSTLTGKRIFMHSCLFAQIEIRFFGLFKRKFVYRIGLIDYLLIKTCLEQETNQPPSGNTNSTKYSRRNFMKSFSKINFCLFCILGQIFVYFLGIFLLHRFCFSEKGFQFMYVLLPLSRSSKFSSAQ